MPKWHKGLTLSKVTAVCIGEQTARRAKVCGMRCRIAREATVEGIEEELGKIASEKRQKRIKA